MKNNKIKFGVLADSLLVFCVSCYIFFSLIPKDRTINVDEIRSLLLVQDCLKNYGCHLRASPDTGSILGISHGAIFLHFLVWVHYLGGGVKECYIIVALCAAGAIAVLYSLAKNLHGMAIGLMTAFMYLYIIFSKGGLALLWNPVLLHLPAALFLFSSLCYIKTKRLIYFIILAFILSLGIQTHLAFLMHFPGFLYLIFLTPKGIRFKTLMAGIGIIIGLTLAASFAIFQNIYLSSPLGNGEPPERNISFALTAVLVGCMSIPIVFLSWRNGKVVRPITLFLLIDYYIGWAILSWFKSPYHRYWYSLFPGLVLLTVESFYFFLSTIVANKKYFKKAVNVITILICWLTIKSIIPNFAVVNPDYEAQKKRKFTMGDAKKIASELSINKRCTYDKVFRHLRGGEHYHFLLQGLGYTFPMSSKSGAFGPDNSCEGDLAVFKMEAAKAKKLPSPEWTVLKDGENAIVIYQYKPYLKWDKFKACFVEQSSGLVNRCLEKEYAFAPSTNPKRMASRWPFGMQELAYPPPFTFYVQVPIDVPSHQPDREIFIPIYKDDVDTCGGFIEEVIGINYKGKLPSNKIAITSKKYPQSGKIIFSWDFGTRTCSLNAYKWMPPPVLEFSQDSFPHDDNADKTLETRSHNKKAGKQNLSSILFKETEKNEVFAQGIQSERMQIQVTTVPLWYVIVVMTLIILGTIASILICILNFGACGEEHS